MQNTLAVINSAKQPAVLTLECEVILQGIEVMADIGVFAAEKGVRQPLNINVTLKVTAPTTDCLENAFNYCHINAFAQELASRRINLIETFAHSLAEKCLTSDFVFEADVHIDKPRAVPGCMAGARVRLRKS